MQEKLNYFSDEYTKEEVKFYGLSEYYENPDEKKKGISVVSHAILGRCDDFLNVNMRIDEDFVCPSLYIDGSIWMSITPMEVQSHVVPIMRATGKVGIAGLGMGYSALRIASKEDVTVVDIWEDDARVIDFFKRNFSDRPEFKKMFFHCGDALVGMPGEKFDSVYLDIWQDLCGDQMLDDMIELDDTLQCDNVSYWGEELIIYNALTNNQISAMDVNPEARKLFSDFIQSEHCNLRPPYVSNQYVEDWLDYRSS